ncbi:MAG: CBS domain-containing protein [Gemmatimonadota bacterium]|nr:CBS domain-containing protein [Gemmatimonadota bacterium]MDE2870554.1 CBS domain-containing protein [Gemmatimonadota bacterium]
MIVVLDIMQTEVVSVTSDMNARELARKLAAEDISGAPVIDGEGALVGVVSQTDLVRLAAREQGLDPAVTTARFDVASGYDDAQDPEDDPGELDAYGFFVPEELPFSARSVLNAVPESRFDMTTVEEIMTPAFYSVRPDLPVTELADYLARGRIQRAVVVEDGRLIGIVTALDVLRAVADDRLGG